MSDFKFLFTIKLSELSDSINKVIEFCENNEGNAECFNAKHDLLALKDSLRNETDPVEGDSGVAAHPGTEGEASTEKPAAPAPEAAVATDEAKATTESASSEAMSSGSY